MKQPGYTIKKSPLMVLIGLAFWVVIAWRYDGLLAPLFSTVSSLPVKVLVLAVVIWINVIWLYGVIHLLSVLFSLFSRPVRLAAERQQMSEHVALLYTTCNDFCWEAAASCVNQDYPYLTVYILDDSDEVAERALVERFCREYEDRCALVRRTDRKGFKAGNLNHALRAIGDKSPFFAVADADEALPSDFVSRALPHFSIDEQIGFVQANHCFRRSGGSRFSNAMSSDAALHWDLFLPARNCHGFVMFYGHGAIIRTDVWRKVGGFPEVVSEDIAFATKARELGYYGIFLKEVVAEEAFPATYAGFLRREIKIVKGTLQFLLGPARSFFRSKEVTLTEKLDLVGSSLVLFLPLFFLGFVVVANIVLPIIYASSSMLSPNMSFTFREWLTNLEPLGTGISELWSWDFYLVTILSILAPLFYQVRAFIRSPLRMAVYAARSTTVFLSIVPSVASAIIAYLFARRQEFVPTGDRTKSGSPRSARQSFVAVFLGIMLSAFAILAGNYALLTIAFAFLLHPILIAVKGYSAFVGVIAILPFIFFLAVFTSIPFLMIGITGALAAAVPAHH